MGYRMPRYVLLSALEDKLNLYVFPLAILNAKGVSLALAPLYLASLYQQLDERMANVVTFVRRCDDVAHVDLCFL